MKHIVREINRTTCATLNKYEFTTAADAMEYAMSMNETMRATDLRYILDAPHHLSFTNSKGNTVHKTFYDLDEALAFTAVLDKRIERGTCGGYCLST